MPCTTWTIPIRISITPPNTTHPAQPDGSSYTCGSCRCEVSAISPLLQMSGVRSSWTRHRSGRRADARLLGRGHRIALASAEGDHPNCLTDRRAHGRTDQAVTLHSTRSYASSVRAPLSGRVSVRGPPAVGTTAVVGMDLTQHGLGALPGVRRTAAARPRVAPCVAGRTHLAVRTPHIGTVSS